MELGINIKLDKPQKIIFLMAFIVIASILIFWIFIYNPARYKMRNLKQELTAIQSEINRIERVAGGEKNLDTAYEKFYKRYSDLERKIPTEERTTFSMLSSEADRMKVEILAMKPKKVRKSEFVVNIDGRSILEMPISMNVRCGYITLGRYLNIIREELPTLVSVDNINIRRAEAREGTPYLDIELELTLYILSK